MSLDLLSSVHGKLIPNSQMLDAGEPAQTPAAGFGGPSFGDTLKNAFENVNSLQSSASNAATSFATGQISDIHSVMIASQKATVALELTTQIRNKIVDAYQQVMQISM